MRMMKTSLASVVTAVFAALVTMPSMGAMVVQSETIDGIEWKYIVSDGAAEVTSGGNSPAIPYETSGEITVPDTLGGYSVTSIGANAFSGEAGSCYLLTGVTMPNSVTNIGYHAFFGCYDLLNVTIGSGVTSIGEEAFADCRSVTNITFKGNAPDIGDYAFDPIGEDCVVHVSYSSTGWDLDDDGTWNGIMVERYLDESSLPEGVAVINGVTNYWLEVVQPACGGVINCESGWHRISDLFYVTVSVEDGYRFDGWTGDLFNCLALSDNSLVVVMNQPRTISADITPMNVSVSINGETVTYNYGDTVTFTAPEPFASNGMQIVTLGTTFTAPVVTNQFTVTVTSDIAFTWDICATNWWLDVETPAHGAIEVVGMDATDASIPGWMPDGTNITLVAVSDAHCHFVRWTGNTNGCRRVEASATYPEGTEVLEVTIDRTRTIGAEFALDVISPGAAANAPELEWHTDGTAGWIGEWTETAADGEHAARSGRIGDNEETALCLTLEGAGVLSFDWRASCEEKYDAVRLVVNGKAIRILSGETSWTNVTVQLETGTHDVRWVYKKGRSNSAGEDAVWIDNVSWTIAQPPTLSDALGDFQWETAGDVAWTAQRSEYAYEGASFAIAAGLDDYQMSILRTEVTGPGRLVFRWAVSCEDGYDWFDFMVDGDVREMTTGENGWQEVSVDLGDGVHLLEWTYWKDEIDDEDLVGANCAMLDYVQWFPQGEEQPTINGNALHEFFEWLKEHNQLSDDQTLADAATIIDNGTCAEGKSMSLYDEFIAGTDPENENDEFRVTITIEGDRIVVSPSPDLGTNRIYTTYGKKLLHDERWEHVEEGHESEYHFFKIVVRMKE